MTIGAASAARLEGTYLPPGSAASAGGAAFVQAPGFSGGYNSAVSGSASGSGYHSGSASAGGAYHGQTNSYQAQSAGYQGQSGARGPQYAITQYNNQNNGDGSYQFNYETENGISAQESGAPQGKI